MTKKRLSELKTGETCKVLRLLSEGGMRRRLLDLGICPGTQVRCVGKSPLGDPMAYLVRDTEVAIRRRDAVDIIIE
jgi:ferrous iron transport protein A